MIKVERFENVLESTVEVKRANGETLDLSVTRKDSQLTGFVVALYGQDDDETGMSTPLMKVELSIVELLHLRTLLGQLEGSIGG